MKLGCVAPGCKAASSPGGAFCAEHLRAPPGTRGGWLSSYKRRAALAAPAASSPATAELYDASNVAPKLWVGAKPPVDRTYPSIDMIVLCAREYQPEVLPHFTGKIVRVAIPDDALEPDEIRRALAGADAVARALVARQRILVTCQMGINRSALVAALALGRVTKMTAGELVALMRAKRHPNALYNAHFRSYLERYLPATAFGQKIAGR